jgi:hypothetical protein
MSKENLTLEEKVDLLLKYHKSARFWGRVRFITGLILFIVLIVLPIVWSVMFLRSFLENVDVQQFMENIKTVGNLGGSLEGIDIQKLLQ